MAHGYLREYDQGWDRGDDRERSDRDWRSSDRDRDREWSERDRGRGFMFGDEDRSRFRDQDEDRSRYRGRDEERGFFSRAGDEARSWFGDSDRSERGAWENNRDWPQQNRGMSDYGREYQQRGFGGSNEWRQGQRSYSANPDDHYRSWRDRQMQSLDRDYQDYCREREQQFHQDFDKWRQNRQQSRPQGSSESSQRTGGNHDELILGSQQQPEAATAGNTPSPTDSATLGTNNSENSGVGRGRR
jgi:hypothetical protein